MSSNIQQPPSAEPQASYQSYPAQSRTAQETISGVPTEVTTTTFADKILVTVSQDGKLGQWFQVALAPRDASVYVGLSQPGMAFQSDPGAETSDEGRDADLLPLPHLSAQTLLGASTPERETAGQLYATQIASSIMARRPDETRLLLIGLGLRTHTSLESISDGGREAFFDLLSLVLRTI